MASVESTVSIIVPVYNVEQYLHQTIGSVCEQTYSNWELILVNDGSKDQSGSICDAYAKKDSRIRVFHTVNKGVSSARNLGIENARGKWITFLDSDDYLDRNCLETLIRYSEGMELVSHSTQDVPTGKLTLLADNVTYYASLEDTRKDLDRLRTYFYSGVWNKLYLREKLTMRFRSELSLGEDYWFNVEYMQNCHGICVLPDILNYHRVSTENSLTKRFRPNVIEDASIIFNAQLRLMGDSEQAIGYLSVNFANKVMGNSIKLAKSKAYSLLEKKAILDRWACHAFWKDAVFDYSALKNRQQKYYLKLLKYRKTWMALFCCQMYALHLDMKNKKR